MARTIFATYKPKDESVESLNGKLTARAYVDELINLFKEPLNNSSLTYLEHEKPKCDFGFSLNFNGCKPLKLAAYPYATGVSDLIRDSLRR